MKNYQKEFHAPDGFEIANVELTPEKIGLLKKTRNAIGNLFSRRN